MQSLSLEDECCASRCGDISSASALDVSSCRGMLRTAAVAHLALQQPPKFGSAQRLNASTRTSLNGALAHDSNNWRKLRGHLVTSLGQRL